MANVPIVCSKFYKPLGYEIETTWKTDPASARIGFLGAMNSARFTYDKHPEAMKEVGGTIDPSTFSEGRKDYRLEIEMTYLKDDNPDNSLLALALGSAPNASTGVITNYPTNTSAATSNLRSFTVELGFDWGGTDKYLRVKGCYIESLEDIWKTKKLTRKLTIIPGTYTSVASPVNTPSLSTLGTLWDASISFTPSLSDQLIKTFGYKILNKFEIDDTTDSGQEIGICQIVDRTVQVDFVPKYTTNDWWTLFEADVNASAGKIGVTSQFSKNSLDEYILATFTNCRPGPEWKKEMDISGEGKLQEDHVILTAESYAFDVKHP